MQVVSTIKHSHGSVAKAKEKNSPSYYKVRSAVLAGFSSRGVKRAAIICHAFDITDDLPPPSNHSIIIIIVDDIIE